MILGVDRRTSEAVKGMRGGSYPPEGFDHYANGS